MSEQDKMWIEKCKADNKKYIIIMVDNDCIFVVDRETDREVYTFDEYGYYFAKALLELIGCNVEFV